MGLFSYQWRPAQPRSHVEHTVVGATGYSRGILIMISQILGGIAASGIVSAMMPNVLAVKTEVGGGTTVVQRHSIEVSYRSRV